MGLLTNLKKTLNSFVLGRSLKGHIIGLRDSLKDRVKQEIRRGKQDNESASVVARRVRGTVRRRFKDGIFSSFTRNIASIIHTTINSFSSTVRDLFFQSIGLNKYRWISVLDKNTTAICRDRSNKIYIVGQGPKPPAHWNCFSEDTDVLTRDGWKRWPDVTGEEEFLSVNLDTLDADYVKAVRLVKYNYCGEMDHYRNNNVDILTTPNHSHVVKFRKKQKGRVGAGYWKLEEGNNLPRWDFNFLATIPEWKGRNGELLNYCGKEVDSIAFMKFLGIYISEGSIVKSYKRKTDGVQKYRISIHQEKYFDHFLETLQDCFGKDVVTGHRNSGKIYIYKLCNNLTEMLLGLGHSHEKFIPEYFKGYDKEHCEAFLQYFALGDGSFNKPNILDGYEPSIMRSHSTSSEKLAGDLSELILKVGKRPSFSVSPPKTVRHHNGVYTSNYPQWAVRECKGQSHSVDKMEVCREVYNGFVYDVELEKWHTLIVRRKGRVWVSGNCRSRTIPYQPNQQIPQSYGEWLRNQPIDVVEDVLGKQKAQWFLSGQLELDNFVNTAGRELTIKELKQRHNI